MIGNRGRVEIALPKTMARDGSILGMTLFNVGRDELREFHAGIAAGLEICILHPSSAASCRSAWRPRPTGP